MNPYPIAITSDTMATYYQGQLAAARQQLDMMQMSVQQLFAENAALRKELDAKATGEETLAASDPQGTDGT
jgi:N12 class adenine-specific DNA methylase